MAFEAAGFRTIAFAETDAYASKVLARRWPSVPNVGDVTKLCRRVSDCVPAPGDYMWCPRCQEEFGECGCIGTDQFTDTYGFPSVITAGFPCQDISKARNCGGKGKYNRTTEGLKGERSGLYWEVPRILRELRPIFFLGENVPNLRTKGADEVLQSLGEEGYAAQAFVVGADAAGADHHRQRAFILAYDKSVGIQGLRPSWEQIAQPLALPFLSVRDSNGQWKAEPDLRRIAHGVSDWAHRVRCLGNAVVPQLVLPFAQLIHQTLTQL